MLARLPGKGDPSFIANLSECLSLPVRLPPGEWLSLPVRLTRVLGAFTLPPIVPGK